MGKEHNFTLDFYKLSAILFISVYHAHIFDTFTRGYIWVEFFFIVSGFFLFDSYCRKKNESLLMFAKKRFMRLYPEYICSWLVLFVSFFLIQGYPYENLISMFLEIFMMQSIGFVGGTSLNYPCWYVSVLFFSSLIVFFLLGILKSERKQSIFSLLLFLIIYFIIFIDTKKIEQWGYKFDFFYVPMMRGVAGLLLGSFINLVSKKIMWKKNFVYNFFEIGIFICIGFSMFQKDINDLITLLLICLLVFLSVSPFSLFNLRKEHKLLTFLMKYEYSIFLNHSLIIFFCKFTRINLSHSLIYLITYLVLLILYSIVFHHVISFLLKLFQRKRLKK